MPRAGLPFAAVGLRAVGFEVDQFETTARDFEGDSRGGAFKRDAASRRPARSAWARQAVFEVSLPSQADALPSRRPGGSRRAPGAVGFFEADQFEMIPGAVAGRLPGGFVLIADVGPSSGVSPPSR